MLGHTTISGVCGEDRDGDCGTSGLCYVSVRREGQGAGDVDRRMQHGRDGMVA